MNLHDLIPLLTLGVMKTPTDGEDIRFKSSTVIGLLWTLVVVGVTGVGLAARLAWDANNELRDLKEQQREVARTLSLTTTDRWTGAMQHYYTDELTRRNPMLVAPDSENIQRRLSR